MDGQNDGVHEEVHDAWFHQQQPTNSFGHTPHPGSKRRKYIPYTPEKLTCPLKRDYFTREYIFQPLIFRFHVSFGEGNIWKIPQNCSPSLTTPSYPSCNGFNPLPRFHCNPRHPKNPKNSESDPSDWSRKYSDSSGVLRAAQPPICLCWNKRHSTP